jgi:hypothetical protein
MVLTPVRKGLFLVRFSGGNDADDGIVHPETVAHNKDAQFPAHTKHQEPVFIG